MSDQEQQQEVNQQEENVAKEEECKAQFTPQVDLNQLPIVETKTLEEDEDVLHQE